MQRSVAFKRLLCVKGAVIELCEMTEGLKIATTTKKVLSFEPKNNFKIKSDEFSRRFLCRGGACPSRYKYPPSNSG